jgi:hypothetical protein
LDDQVIKNVEEKGCGLDGLRKTTEILGIVDVPTQIHLRHLPNTRQNVYHLEMLQAFG